MAVQALDMENNVDLLFAQHGDQTAHLPLQVNDEEFFSRGCDAHDLKICVRCGCAAVLELEVQHARWLPG